MRKDGMALKHAFKGEKEKTERGIHLLGNNIQYVSALNRSVQCFGFNSYYESNNTDF